MGLLSWLTGGERFGSFIDDRDGQKYTTVKIGNLVWMAQNLNYQTESGSWCYNNDNSNSNIYGRLYDWETAKNASPTGWRLPSKDDWAKLVAAAGSSEFEFLDAGKKLKSKSGWSKNSGTDKFGFSALPGGYRRSDGTFNNAGDYGCWWTATEHDGLYAYNRYMYHNIDLVGEDRNYKRDGYSVRCVQDA